MKKLFKKYFYYLFLLALIFFLFYKHSLNADEGVILNGAWNLFNKRTLYVDFFEIIAPGSFYLINLFFKLFSPNYFIANIVSLIILWLGSLGIYQSTNLIQKNKLNFLFPIFFILSLAPFPIINHNLYSTVLLIWSSYFFIKGIKSNSLKNFIISGFLGGLSIIFLQQKGIAFCAASFIFILFFILKNKNYYFKNILGYCVGIIIPVICLFLKWSPNLLWKNLIVFPMLTYWEVNQTSFLLLLSFFLVLFYFFIYFIKKSILIKYLLFVQFFLLLSTIPLPDYYHLIINIFPLLILSSLLLANNNNKMTKLLIIVFIFILNIPTFSYLKNNYKPFYSCKKNPDYQELMVYIEKKCEGKYIYSGPFLPNLYLETKKLSATPFGLLIENQSTDEQYNEALNYFKKNQPTCAVLNYYDNMYIKFNSTGNNVLENYIKNNYKLEYQKNNFFIYHQ